MADLEIPDDALWMTYDDVDGMSAQVADQIIASGQLPDNLLVLPRGGLMPANIISRRLNMLADTMLSANVSSYATGITERATDFTVGQVPTAEEVVGMDILIVDEVCDTGHTLEFVTGMIHDLGARSVRSAVLHFKPSRSQTGIVPDFYVDETDKWVVYPWERHEAAGLELQASRQLLRSAATLDA